MIHEAPSCLNFGQWTAYYTHCVKMTRGYDSQTFHPKLAALHRQEILAELRGGKKDESHFLPTNAASSRQSNIAKYRICIISLFYAEL